MRKLKEILRLKYGCALSHRQISKSLSISASVVSRYANRAAQLGITDWPLASEWDDAYLQRAFMGRVPGKLILLPFFRQVEEEL